MIDLPQSCPADCKALRALFDDPESAAERIVLQSDESVYDRIDSLDYVHFVVEGQVRLYQTGPRGTERMLGILGAGEWFGVVALAGRSTIHHRGVSVGQTELLRAPVSNFTKTLLNYPQAAVDLARCLARKLVTAVEDAADMIFDDVTARLIKAMLRFSTSPAARRTADGVSLCITHSQLAQAVGVARETVSVTLTQLRLQGLIQTGRNQLIFDPARLTEFLREAKKLEESPVLN